jgi:hypothetical protein
LRREFPEMLIHILSCNTGGSLRIHLTPIAVFIPALKLAKKYFHFGKVTLTMM